MTDTATPAQAEPATKSPRTAWLIPLRNKERHVARAIRSVFAQTVPLDLIVSDQMSTDRSRDVALSLVAHRSNPASVRMLYCTEDGEYGMEGLNANLMYAIRATDYDRYLILSADDTVEPRCAEIMLDAFDKHGVDAVGGNFAFIDPAGKEPPMRSPFPPESRLIKSWEHLEHRVGGSSFRGLTRDLALWKPLASDTICDVWWTYWACARNGYWCEAKEHTGSYWKHADSGNAGLEGRRRAAGTPIDNGHINLALWQEIMRTWARILGEGAESDGKNGWTWAPDDKNTAIMAVLNLAMGYGRCWDELRRLENEARGKAAPAPVPTAA